MPRTAIIVVVSCALLAAAGVFLSRSDLLPRSSGRQIDLMTTTELPLDVPIETATLDVVDEAEGQGVATRQYIDGIYVFGVTGALPDPPVGESYLVWLVQGADLKTAVKAGKLVKQGDGYGLDYTSPVDYSAYSEVIVTRQVELTVPGTVVLRGAFPVE